MIPSSGERSIFWIETDLEPDDVLALALLPKASYYVAGEGDASVKYRRMVKYCKLISIPGLMASRTMRGPPPIIIQGQGSNRLFADDGKEFSSLDCDAGGEHDYLTCFRSFAESELPVMFSLKPLRELLGEYMKDPCMVKSLVARVELYVYGDMAQLPRANFRSLKGNRKELLELLNSFKKLYIYESFYASGEKNSVNKDNCPRLYKFIMDRSGEAFYEALLRLTKNWNRHLIAQQESMNNRSSNPRSKKTMENIYHHEDFQFVLADFALAAVYREITPVPISNLNFDKDCYTTFDVIPEGLPSNEPCTSNLYAYMNIPFGEIEDLIVKYLPNKVD